MLKYDIDLFLPKKTKIAILDNPGSDLIKKTLNQNNLPVISIRKSSKINLLIILLSFFQNYKYTKGQRYIIAYIKYLKPKVIISHIDNNIFFFSLKKIFCDVKFVFIQNGIGVAHWSKLERKKLSFYADVFFSYSKPFSKIYSKFLKSKIYSIGSFKNNLLNIKKNKKKKIIVFISQFRVGGNKKNKDVAYSFSGRNFSLEKLYRAESLILPILYKFCKERKYKLVIAGSNFDYRSMLREKKFFKEILEKSINNIDSKFYEFKKLNDVFSSYNLIDNSALTVFIDSALGYQSLARGNKTLACSFRSKYVENKNLSFGWPNNFSNEGPFWINNYKPEKIKIILSNLLKMNDRTWQNTYKKYKKDLLPYGFKNKTFKECIKQLLKN